MSELPDLPPINAKNFPHGVLCGCACGCNVPLTDGNAMQQDITEPRAPWEANDVEPRIALLICADCYVGSHCDTSRSRDRGTP